MNTRELPFFSNPETIGMEKICGVIDKIYDCNDGFRSTFIKTFKGAFKIITYFGAYILFKNYEKIWNPIKLLILKIVYTRLIIKKENEILISEKFKKMLPPSKEEVKNELWISGAPLYLEKEGNECIVYNIPYLHSSFMKELLEEENHQPAATVCKDETGKVFTPLEMFPSINYIGVDEIVKKYFEVFRDTKMITPPILFANSPAGYGKTNVMHYLARNEGESRELRLVDLTSPVMVNKSFSSIVAEITNREYNIPMIIAFDELDKYVSAYTQHIYTSSQKGIKKDMSCNMDEVVDDDFHIFERQVKLSVITTIGRLDSVKNFHKGVVWLFFSNNIHTIFRGLDQTHINAIKTRLTFIEFKKCDRQEVMRYLTVFNDKLKNPNLKVDDFRLKCALRKLKMDTSVTFRQIQICMNKAAWDIEKTVEYLNEGIFNPLLEYNGEVDVIPEYTSSKRAKESDKEAVMQIAQLEDAKMKIELSREKIKEKTEIARDMAKLIYFYDYKTDKEHIGDLPTEELIAKLNEMRCGYNLVKLAEIQFRVFYVDNADVADHDDIDIESLAYVCAMYRADILEYLLKLGLDPNHQSAHNLLRETSVRRKSLGDNCKKSCLLLVKHGADLGKKYYNILLGMVYDKEILKCVIEQKNININTDTFVNLITQKTQLTIDIGLMNNFTEWLVEFGMEKKYLDMFMLECIASQSCDPDIIELFLDKNMDVTQYTRNGCSVMFFIITNGSMTFYGSTPVMKVDIKRKLISRILEMGGSSIKIHRDNNAFTKKYFTSCDSQIIDMIPEEMFYPE